MASIIAVKDNLTSGGVWYSKEVKVIMSVYPDTISENSVDIEGHKFWRPMSVMEIGPDQYLKLSLIPYEGTSYQPKIGDSVEFFHNTEKTPPYREERKVLSISKKVHQGNASDFSIILERDLKIDIGCCILINTNIGHPLRLAVRTVLDKPDATLVIAVPILLVDNVASAIMDVNQVKSCYVNYEKIVTWTTPKE